MPPIVRTLIKILLPLIILGGAVAGAVTLVKSRPQAQKQVREVKPYLVETFTVSRTSHRLDVRAQGTVESARRVQLQPQIAGRLTFVEDGLIPGGLLQKGTTLVKIDATDYQIALTELQTSRAEAEARLEQERGQQIIAQREWELFEQNATKETQALEDPSLALRKPQLKIAQVAVDAADARIKRARLDLSRTTLKAPFNALVISENAETGQLVSSQSVIATLVGTDAFWVRASVPLDQLTKIEIPGLNSDKEYGSEVTIETDLGGKTTTRKGNVIRLLGELDQVGRMAQILVEVKDPLALGEDKAQIPLLLGSYVQILFAGSQQRELIEIPRQALHDGDEVWIYSKEDKLDVRQVRIAATRPDTVLISEGIENGELVITSRIGNPIQDMLLRRSTEEGTAQKKAALEADDAPKGGAR